MKKAETANEINRSRSQLEMAGLTRFGAVAEGIPDAPELSKVVDGGVVEWFSLDTDFILLV